MALRTVRSDAQKYVNALADRDHSGRDDVFAHQLLRLIADDTAVLWPWMPENPQCVLVRLHTCAPPDAEVLSRRLVSAALAIAPAAGSLPFLMRMMRLKPREFWIPAVALVAHHLTTDRAHTLAPLKLEAHAATGKDAEGISARHLRVLAALTAALQQRAFAGHDAKTWTTKRAARALPDFDDLSALAGGSVELAYHCPEACPSLREVAVDALRQGLDNHGDKLGYQFNEAAQRAVERFENPEAAWAVLLRPIPENPVLDINPLDERAVKRATSLTAREAERLYDAHDTLIWLRGRRDQEGEARLFSRVLAGADTLVAATNFHSGQGQPLLSDAATWLPSLRIALARLEPNLWNASPSLAQAEAFTTALVLVRAPFARNIDWRAAVGEVDSVWLKPSEGTTGQRGWVDLIGIAAQRGILFSFLLHRGSLDVQNRSGKNTGTRLETVGLSRLLRARWQIAGTQQSTVTATESQDARHRLDAHLTNQCANHLVRRLLISNDEEAACLLVAALAADAPKLNARFVDRELKDELWQKVATLLPDDMASPKISAAIERLCALEQNRSAQGVHAEAKGYLEVTLQFENLNAVSQSTRDAWQHLVAMSQESPFGENRRTHPAAAPVRNWLKNYATQLSNHLKSSAEAIQDTLGEKLQDHELWQGDVATVLEASKCEVLTVTMPVLEPTVNRKWRDASASLRRLAEPLPWFVESQLDETLQHFDDWLELCTRNYASREALLDRINHALRDADEEVLEAILDEENGSRGLKALIAEPELRRLSHFWLRRLRFDRNLDIPSAARVTPYGYYSPMLLAVLGAPLQTVQTNYIWQPLIGDPFTGVQGGSTEAVEIGQVLRIVVVSVFFLGVCLMGILYEVRRRLTGLDLRQTAMRTARPLGVLLGINYAVAFALWWVAGWRLEALVTTFLWGTLSLYLGLFLGLFAQGSRIDRDSE